MLFFFLLDFLFLIAFVTDFVDDLASLASQSSSPLSIVFSSVVWFGLFEVDEAYNFYFNFNFFAIFLASSSSTAFLKYNTSGSFLYLVLSNVYKKAALSIFTLSLTQLHDLA